MAARKKTATKRKKTTARGNSSALQLEIQNLLILLILVLITLCVFLHNRMGTLGVLLYDACIGMFGFSAYLLCIYFLLLMILKIAGVLNQKKMTKWIAILFCILLLSVFLHVLHGDLSVRSISELYKAGSYKNGGAFGGIVGTGLIRLLGRTGSIVVLLWLFIIALVLISEKSLIKLLERLTGHAAKGARNTSDAIRQRREQQRILLEQKREEERRLAEKEQRSIIINGIPEQESLQAANKKPKNVNQDSRFKEDEGKNKKPIQDGQVDIPILDPSQDAYLERKRRHQQRSLQHDQSMKPRKKQKEQEEQHMEAVAAEADKRPQEEELVQEEPVQSQEIPVILHEEDEKDDALETEPMYEDVEAEPEELPTEIPVTLAEEKESQEERLPLEAVEDEETEEEYQFPSIDLLSPGDKEAAGESREDLMHNAKILEDSLMSFGVEAKVLQVNKGPAVTRYELQPKQGVKVSRIVNLADDIALNLAASGIRIEAPIPGKSAIGIEIPNKEAVSVPLRGVIESDRFRKFPSPLAFALGKDIDGNVQIADIAKMPHLLIAGATGSGKSVCINSLLISILYKADPKDVKLILIDPKVVELSVYNGIPHLLIPVVNDPRKAALSLNWAVQEMTKRYQKFADLSVRDIRGYNEAVKERPELELAPMPKIVIIIDELADLMMVSSKEVEEAICRLAQMARAAGLHLVIATQRPSVDVITGLIKANIPSRLAFAVSSGTDSRTILDMVGAEKLLGKGDMLFAPMGTSKPIRIQGCWVSDKEVEAVVNAVRTDTKMDPDLVETVSGEGGHTSEEEEELDEYLEQAIQYVVDKQKASISMLQRVFRIGFNRAARLMDALYERGIVGPDEGSKPRKVLITSEELHQYEDA